MMWLALLRSRLVQAGLVIAILAVAFPATYWTGKRKGQMVAREEERVRAAEALAQADRKYREKEQDHAREIADLRVEFAKADAKEDTVDARASAELRTGERRMRIRVAVPVPAGCPDPAQAGPAPSGADGANGAGPAGTTAEIDPATAGKLYAIPVKGDEAIRRLTAMQAWAREAVKLCH